MRHAPSRISTRSKKRPRHTASTSMPSSRERTLIDMRVCAIARAPLISAMVPPRKCCERDPLPKEAWQDATKASKFPSRSEEHTSELQSLTNLVCRLLLEKKKKDQPAGDTIPRAE